MLRKAAICTFINKFGYDLVKPDPRLVINGPPADFDEDIVDTYNTVKSCHDHARAYCLPV